MQAVIHHTGATRTKLCKVLKLGRQTVRDFLSGKSGSRSKAGKLLLEWASSWEGAVETACSVCLEMFAESDLHELNCGHVTHEGCADRWLQHSSACPQCKYGMQTWSTFEEWCRLQKSDGDGGSGGDGDGGGGGERECKELSEDADRIPEPNALNAILD